MSSSKMADENMDGDEEIDEKWKIHRRDITPRGLIQEAVKAKVSLASYNNETVVLKEIKPRVTPAKNERAKKRFRIEVALMSTLEHKNIAKFIGVVRNEMIIVMEYVGKDSLAKFLSDLRPYNYKLDLRRCLRFALDITDAMEYLHANQIIHRDLKPDNIVLTDDKKKLKVKLIDFGYSRKEETTEMTANIGTLKWMAPELFDPSEDRLHYTHKVDVYSFAIVLWEMITNCPPYDGKTPLRAAHIASKKKERPPLEGIPDELCNILQKCWAHDPNERPEFSTIRQMLLDVWTSNRMSIKSLMDDSW